MHPMHTEHTKFCPRKNRVSNCPMMKPGGRAAQAGPEPPTRLYGVNLSHTVTHTKKKTSKWTQKSDSEVTEKISYCQQPKNVTSRHHQSQKAQNQASVKLGPWIQNAKTKTGLHINASL